MPPFKTYSKGKRRSVALWKEYHLAQTITDALQTLAAAPGSARVIAGGTDLMLDLQQGRHPPVDTLVDVTNIPELTSLELRQGSLFIGAGVPLNKIIESLIVNEHAQALIEACRLIGGPQVRNTATLGGNVAHALPAGDGTISLLSLGAMAEVARVRERKFLQLTDLFLGPGQSALEPRTEILVGFIIPLKSHGEASVFRRVMRPQGVAIAILNMAVWIKRADDRILDSRIAVGPSGPTPKRARNTEAFLKGKHLDEKILSQAKETLLSESHFRTSPHRATSEYRRHISGVLLEETLTTAWMRAEDQADS